MKRNRDKPIKTVKHQRRSFSKRFRRRICQRDNYTCQLCGKDLKNLPEQRVLDHKIPLDKFGNNEHYNIWLLCQPCDRAKKNKLIEPCVHQHIENRVDYLKKKFKLS